MKRLEKKTLLSAIFGALVLGGSFFLNFYLFQTIKNASSRLLSLKEKSVLATEKETQASLWKAQSASLEKDLKKVRGVFVSPQMPIELISFVEESAEKAGVGYEISLVSSGSGKKKEQTQFRTLTLKVNGKGGFSRVARFLDYLENSPYVLKIRNLSISTAPEKKKNQVRFNVQIEALTYEYKKAEL